VHSHPSAAEVENALLANRSLFKENELAELDQETTDQQILCVGARYISLGEGLQLGDYLYSFSTDIMCSRSVLVLTDRVSETRAATKRKVDKEHKEQLKIQADLAEEVANLRTLLERQNVHKTSPNPMLYTTTTTGPDISDTRETPKDDSRKTDEDDGGLEDEENAGPSTVTTNTRRKDKRKKRKRN
jgi:hypothetical protein